MTPTVSLPGGSTSRPQAGDIAVTGSRAYHGGHSDHDVNEAGIENGTAGTNDTVLYGPHDDHTIGEISEAHNTAASMIGYRMRETVGGIVDWIDKALPSIDDLNVVATQKIDEWHDAAAELRRLQHRMRSTGLSLPQRKDRWKSLAALALLFVGDLALVAVAYQILGLSDAPWIPGFGFTDDLHLAALATVVLLLILAHVAGGKVRRFEYDVDQRRREVDLETRASMPKPSCFDVVLVLSCMSLAGFALWGVAAIRLDYLAQSGIIAQPVPFVAVQIGVLAAAIAVSYHYANPLKREYEDAKSSVERTEVARDESITAVETAAGDLNAAIDSVPTEIAKAGHHVTADSGNAHRQVELYEGRYILSLPEPSSEVSFRRSDGGVRDHDDLAALRVLLTGITPIPHYSQVDVGSVTEHLAKAVKSLRKLNRKLRKLELRDSMKPRPRPVESTTGEAAPDPAVITSLPAAQDEAA